MRKKTGSLDNTALATTIAVATGVLTAGCVLFSANSSDSMSQHAEHPAAEHASANPNDKVNDSPSHEADPHGESSGQNSIVEPTPATTSTTANVQPQSIAKPTSAPPSASGPLVFADNMKLETPTLSFNAVFPSGAHAQPAYQALMKDTASYRTALRRESAAAEIAANAQGISYTPWDIDIGYTETARAGNVVSILGRELSYKGGVHPNIAWRGFLSNIETGAKIQFSDMFLPRKANSPAFVIGVCEALKAEKIERIGEASIEGFPVECGDPDVLEKLKNGAITLTRSTEGGRFGGATVHFAPYQVGVYAEGSYSATVSQEAFYHDLRQEYRALFSGKPAQ